jgi:hypothetical protein
MVGVLTNHINTTSSHYINYIILLHQKHTANSQIINIPTNGWCPHQPFKKENKLNDLFLSGTFTSLPSTWDELTARQYVQVVDTLLLQPGPNEQKRIKLLKILTGWGWLKLANILGWWRYNPIRFIRTKKIGSGFGPAMDRTERLATAAEELTTFLFAECDLTKNLLPNIGKYYGPSDYLDNLRMGEFVYAESYFSQWKQNADAANLNKLVSVLYRPAGSAPTPADRREAFDPNLCAQHLQQIEGWPLAKRVAIAIMYGSMRKQLIDQNPRVFSDSGDSGNESVYGMWSVMRQVAKDGHFGTFTEVENTYVSTILMELNESIIEAERQAERMESVHPGTALSGAEG